MRLIYNNFGQNLKFLFFARAGAPWSREIFFAPQNVQYTILGIQYTTLSHLPTQMMHIEPVKAQYHFFPILKSTPKGIGKIVIVAVVGHIMSYKTSVVLLVTYQTHCDRFATILDHI